MKKIGILLIICLQAIVLQAQKESPKQLLQKMLTAIENANTLQFQFVQKERVKSGWNNAVVDIKLQVEPQKIYIKCIDPNEGAELLLVDGKYNGYVYVNPNGFPYINLRLNQYGFLLLGDEKHHPIDETGFGLFHRAIQSYFLNPSVDINELVDFKGMVQFDNRSCYYLELHDPNYHLIDYTVQGKENILEIAQRNNIADYVILEFNEGVDNYFDVKAGQVIKIPSAYAPKAKLYLDSSTFLPLLLEMHDDKGLYEHYEFLNLKVNPDFAEDEFSDEFSEYGF